MAQRSRTRPTLLSPWRRRFQWLVSLTILLLPWVQVDGKSLLRIDIDTLSLHLFGQVLRIEELYLLLFFSLCLVLLFLLVTLVMGRVWCGWACPQTTLSDIAEWLARKLGLKVVHNTLAGPTWRKLLAHFFFVLLSLTVGANLVWYFIEPFRFFSSIASSQLHPGAWLSLLVVALPVYLDLALIRRLMCSEFCPYGRFQSALVDPGTLNLLLPNEERDRCIECGSCIRVCPMGIDIRRGYQIECINCGRCLDACRQVMSEWAEDGLIHYRFGLEKKGARALLNLRTLMLASALLCLSVILGTAVLQRAEASLKVSMSHTAASRLIDADTQVTFYSAWLNNRAQGQKTFGLVAYTAQNDSALELKGQVNNLLLGGGQNLRVEFALLTPPVKKPLAITLALKDLSGMIHARAEATVLPLSPGQ